MRLHFASIIVLILLLGPLPSAAAPEGLIVDYFIIQYASISPNGDGARDSSLVRVGLRGPCTALRLTLTDPWGSPIDTLLDEAGALAGTYTAVWNGRGPGGGTLAEGSYRLRLAARDGGLLEEYERVVIVDLTAPLVSIERIEPGIYAPGVAGTADSVLVYFSIARYGPGDTLSMIVRSAANTSTRSSIPISGDGGYRAAWGAPITAADGIYGITLLCADEGGNATVDSAAFDVDTKGPDQQFIDKPPPMSNNPPLVITGSAYDRNGVSILELVWQGGSPSPPDSTYTRGDTLFWKFDMTDSLPEGGGGFSLKSRCSDMFSGSPRHTTEIEVSFSIDITPPAAPVLQQPPSPVREPSVVVHGTMDESQLKYVFLYRTAERDTVIRYEPGGASFAASVPLCEGTNVIRATVQDRAGNTSDFSNAVTVVYERADEVAWPEVFRGPDAFRIYSKQPARQVTVDIYALNGELVASLRESGPAQSFVVTWNLRNDDGEEVRNGAYLAVVSVKYGSMTSVYKEFVAVVR